MSQKPEFPHLVVVSNDKSYHIKKKGDTQIKKVWDMWRIHRYQ